MPVTSELDHLIWGAPELDRAVADMAERFGSPPVAGGSHPGVGTRNALLGLENRQYFEILAPDPEQTVFSGFGRWVETLDHARLLTWAGRTDDLEGLTDSARRAGLEPGEIVSMGRRKPDGTSLKWRLMTVGGHDFGLLVPFFIQWADAHPCDALPAVAGLRQLEISSPEPDALHNVLAALGLSDAAVSVHPGAPGLQADLRARGHRIPLANPATG